MKNFKLIVQYDGTRYSGWQRQENTKATIQGRLENILERLEGHSVEIHGSGRTDAGVHAYGQTANAKLNWDRTPEELRDYINTYLPKDIAVIRAEEVEMSFHSRLNAVCKTYCYRIRTSAIPSVFERNYVWQLGYRLDVGAMEEAMGYLIGEHDFLPFCELKKMKKSSVRRIDCAKLEEKEDEIRLVLTGNGFLYHMVRKITGTLVEIGKGEKQPQVVNEILKTGNRELTGGTAPAQGLALMAVVYPKMY